jgi:hypothetical protein
MNTRAGDDEAARIEATQATLEAAARDAGFWMSADGRVGEADAATLLGYAPGTLSRKRAEGDGPRCYRMGGGGYRVTYRLHELARYIETAFDAAP